jgi:hypothetical protein
MLIERIRGAMEGYEVIQSWLLTICDGYVHSVIFFFHKREK